MDRFNTMDRLSKTEIAQEIERLNVEVEGSKGNKLQQALKHLLILRKYVKVVRPTRKHHW